MKLEGMNAICNHVGLTESTVILKIQREGFPAKKNKEGIWIADKKEVDSFLAGPQAKKKKSKKAAGKKAKKDGTGRNRRVKPDGN